MPNLNKSCPLTHVSSNLEDNVNHIESSFGNSGDVIIKELLWMQKWPAALFYIDGLVNTQLLHDSVLRSLMRVNEHHVPEGIEPFNYLKDQVLIAGHSGSVDEMDALFNRMLSGGIIILLDGYTKGIWIDAVGWEDRNVSEPQSQTVVRGPMEGFTENLRTNTALLRRRIRDPRLWMETRQIGQVTHTNVSVMYIKGIADEEVIQELRDRLDRIDIDGILEGGYIEEEIQDETFTPFPTIYNSERPDSVAASLLEGRIAILVDGTPFVLLIPALFVQFFQSAEDYYQRADISTLLRLLRFFSFFIAMLAPAVYIAITTFHQEMLPTNLLISLAAQREGVPFPAFVEAMLMEITYEILREAGVRIPKTVGQAVSIVGTLVIGQAAVDAGVVSAAMVIVVSITAISSYVIPENGLSIAVRIVRFALMMLAAAFGLLGILMGIIVLLLHLTSLRSFGVSYMSPFGPYVESDLKDTLFRLPWSYMKSRPQSTPIQNTIRQKTKKRRIGNKPKARRDQP
ncbi:MULTISPECIES: spore germination protein [Paenibacillus]|uniref:Spore germination protein n=1 Tax=Paenibacillus ottowii TaxID=2315729 RepID=A0ABY3B644_9BACL|nr:MULTISPECIES: spore germination protein [Paenibacillus]KZE71520.1 spore gernimation protein KA [Paenibacillus jamilae]NEU24725.1 spore germination protein [Paenibacillus polymyxa]OBA05073.1 spore gernimation protein KA [Paenibacillus polymyxa]TQR97710.1 spore germination protein [Paenibacillus ottowii]